MEYSSFLKRLGAGAIDGVIFSIFFFGLAIFLALCGIHSDALTLALLFVAFCYTPVMCSSQMQATIGMRVFKMKMVTTDGNRVGLPQSFVRAFLEAIGMLVSGGFFYPLYMMIMIGCTQKHQLLQDIICKVCIIDTE